jgi:hypothetical protein
VNGVAVAAGFLRRRKDNHDFADTARTAEQKMASTPEKR